MSQLINVFSCNQADQTIKFISCIAIDQYIVCGGYDGTVHVLKYQNLKSPIIQDEESMQLNSKALQYSKLLSYQAHKVMIMNLDTRDNIVVSAALDGSIYWYQIDTNQIYQLQLNRPVKGIQLYGQSSSFISRTSQPQFIYTNEHRLAYNTSSLLNNSKNVVYFEESEPIENVHAFGKLIVTSNLNELRIYEEKTLIYIVKKDLEMVPQVQIYENTVIVGWKNWVAMFAVNNRKVELIFEANLGILICGVGLLEDKVLILGYPRNDVKGISVNSIMKVFDFESDIENHVALKELDHEFTKEMPLLALLNPRNLEAFEQVFALKIPDFKNIRPSEYKFLCKNGIFSISTPQIMLLGQPTTIQDQVGLLVKDNKVEQAFQLLIKITDPIAYRTSKLHKFEDEVFLYRFPKEYRILSHKIGITLMNLLYENERYEDCAALAPSILTQDWKEWLVKFKNTGHIKILAAVIPFESNYLDEINLLIDYLKEDDLESLMSFVSELPIDQIPFADELIIELESLHHSKKHPQKHTILETLEILYEKTLKYDKLIITLLELKSYDKAYKLIAEYPYLLPNVLQCRALFWMELNDFVASNQERYEELDLKFVHYFKTQTNKTAEKLYHSVPMKLVIHEIEHLSVQNIANQLKEVPKHLFVFLHVLFEYDSKKFTEYHNMLLELYAEFDHHKLMSFLRSSSNYSLEKAVNICESRAFVNETLFLYGRMGNSKGAVKTILEKLKDYKLAIDFAKEQKDPNVWEELVTYATKYPIFWPYLLEHGSFDVAPLKLVENIPNNAKIENLKSLLLKVMNSCNIEIALSHVCSTIMINDCLAKMKSHTKHSLDSSFVQLTKDDLELEHTYLLFGCGHVFSESSDKSSSQNTELRQRSNSLSSISSTSTVRKFRKNTRQLKILVESERLRQVAENPEVECPVCIRTASLINN
eukprot:NODE_46_length_32145_cov_0.918711.p1 type:complete len:933 gc:universal NODE_46_length_32145_cov_0.918711:15699-18497(+)